MPDDPEPSPLLPGDLRIHGDGTIEGTIARFGGTVTPLEILSYEVVPAGGGGPDVLAIRIALPAPEPAD